ARTMLDVHLVHDARIRRHHLEVAECGLAPAQERIALAITLELDGVVARQRVRRAVSVHLYGVVDDEFGGRERIDFLRVAAELDHGLAHGGEIDHRGYAGEVLHDDPTRRKGDLVGRRRLGVPVQQRFYILAPDVHAILETQQVLEQDLQRVGQAGHVAVPQCGEAEYFEMTAAASERRARLERVFHASSGNGM